MTKTSTAIPLRSWLPILLLIVVAAIGIRVHFAAGFTPKDDAEFARVAYEVMTGTFSLSAYGGPPVIPTRTGMIVPTAMMFALFGPNEVSMAIYPLVMSVCMLLLIYAFCAVAFNHGVARVASVIWIFLPMELEISTTLWPDVPTTAFAFAGLFCIFLARKRYLEQGRQLIIAGALGGVAFGLSWLCKASVIYYIPFCFLLMAYDLKRHGRAIFPLWGAVAAGSLLVFVSELLIYKSLTGDLFYRFAAIERNYDLYPEFFFIEGGNQLKAIIKRVVIDGPAFMLLNGHFLYLPTFGLLAGLYALYRRDEDSYFFVLLLATLLLMFNFFSASLEDYQPLTLYNRYFYPLCIPGVILTARLLMRLIQGWQKSEVRQSRPEPLFWGAVVVGLVVVVTGWSMFRTLRDDSGPWAQAEKTLSAQLSPTDHIVTDALSRNSLEFYWGYPERMNVAVYGNSTASFSVVCGAYVLRNASYNEWLGRNAGMWLTTGGFNLPDLVSSPPANWQSQWSNGNAELFHVICDPE